MKLFTKNSNLCGHVTPSVIDGQTNGRTHAEIAMAIQRSA